MMEHGKSAFNACFHFHYNGVRRIVLLGRIELSCARCCFREDVVKEEGGCWKTLFKGFPPTPEKEYIKETLINSLDMREGNPSSAVAIRKARKRPRLTAAANKGFSPLALPLPKLCRQTSIFATHLIYRYFRQKSLEGGVRGGEPFSRKVSPRKNLISL